MKKICLASIILILLTASIVSAYENNIVSDTPDGVSIINIKDESGFARFFRSIFGGTQQEIISEPDTPKPGELMTVKVFDSFRCTALSSSSIIKLTRSDGSIVWSKNVDSSLNDLLKSKCSLLAPTDSFFGIIAVTFTAPASGSYILNYDFKFLDGGTKKGNPISVIVSSVALTSCDPTKTNKEIYQKIDGGIIYRVTVTSYTLSGGQCLPNQNSRLVTECSTGFGLQDISGTEIDKCIVLTEPPKESTEDGTNLGQNCVMSAECQNGWSCVQGMCVLLEPVISDTPPITTTQPVLQPDLANPKVLLYGIVIVLLVAGIVILWQRRQVR